MVIAGIWAVMARNLLKSAISLAIVSVIVTILMFRLNAPLAGVFELSVCTGLITVIFIGAVSITKPMTKEEAILFAQRKLKKYIYLPFLAAFIGIAGMALLKKVPAAISTKVIQDAMGVREILWNVRQLDLFGEIVLLVIGAFGVVMLFKETLKR